MELSFQPSQGSSTCQLNHSSIAQNHRNPQRDISTDPSTIYQQDLVKPLLFKTIQSGPETINLYCPEMGYLYNPMTGSFSKMNAGSLPLRMPGTNKSTFQLSNFSTAQLPYNSPLDYDNLQSLTHGKTATFSFSMESKPIQTLSNNNKLTLPATNTEKKTSQDLQINLATTAKSTKNPKMNKAACAIDKPIPPVQTEYVLPFQGNLSAATQRNYIPHIQETVPTNNRSKSISSKGLKVIPIKSTPARDAKSKAKKSAKDRPALSIQIESVLPLQCNSVTSTQRKVATDSKFKSKSSLDLVVKASTTNKSKITECIIGSPRTSFKMKSALPPPDVSVPKFQKTVGVNTKSRSKYSLGLPVNETAYIKSIPASHTNSKATEHVTDIPFSPVKTKFAQPLQGSLSKSTKGYFVESNQRTFFKLTYAEIVKMNLDKPARLKSVVPLIGIKPPVCPRKIVLSSQKKPTPTKKKKPRKKSKKKQNIQEENISCRVGVPYRQSKLQPLRQCKKNYVDIGSILKPFNRRSRHHKIQHHCQIKPTWNRKCKNQIMASAVHEIINNQFVKKSKSSMSPALIHNILNCSYKIRKTAQPWTMSLEKEAIENYKKLKLENDNKKVQVSDCGLFTSSEKRWLAGVCREVYTRDSEECWPLLVKCLHKHPDSTLVQATKHRSFCLKKEGYIYTLRNDHAYYTQLQFLMDITDTVYAELLMHTNKETAIVPVWIDFDFLENAKEKLERFYTDTVLPYLQKNEGCKRRPQHHKNFHDE